MMPVGKRNRLEQLAASRVARDLHQTRREAIATLAISALVIGTWAVVKWFIRAAVTTWAGGP